MAVSFKNVNKRYWGDMTPEQLEAFVEVIFQHYRENGYPHHRMTEEEKTEEYRKLYARDFSDLITPERMIKQIMAGLSLLWTYFPDQYIKIRNGNNRTPYENFVDDDVFREVIRRRLKHGDYIGDSAIRKALRVYKNAKGVSNFRPTAAAAIYSRYCRDVEGGAIVWDMSAGFGGRLLGALLSKAVKTYIGSDPEPDTILGLQRIAHDAIEATGSKMKVRLLQMGSETVELPDESIHFAFTSPPYFNTEKYSTHPDQSYIKFPTYREWVEGFLNETIRRVARALKPGGILAMNVADTKTAPTLVRDTIVAMLSEGLEHVEDLHLQLSGSAYKLPADGTRRHPYRYEPVLAYRKPK